MFAPGCEETKDAGRAALWSLVGPAGEALVGEGCPQPLPTAVWSRATSQGLPNQSSGFVSPGQHFQCTSLPGNPLPLVEKQSRPASEHFLLDQNPAMPHGSQMALAVWPDCVLTLQTWEVFLETV